MALVLVLAALGCHVRMPTLGHPATGQLHLALRERGLELQQEQVLLDVEDGRGHGPSTLATPDTSYPACRCPLNTSSRCTGSRGSTPPTRRSSRTSRSPFCRGRRSACSATTARASRPCCGSWPASIRSTAATPRSPPGRPSACSSRSRI